MPKPRSRAAAAGQAVTPAGRSRSSRRKPTRARILGAAARLFAEKGFAGVSMPAIAKASGITAGAIYKHFAGKEDLFFQVIRQAVEAVPSPAPAGPFEVATDLPTLVASYATPRLKLLRQLAVEVHSASARHPKVRRLLQGTLDLRIAELTDAIAAAQRAGSLDPEPDPRFLASALMVFILGLMHMETLAPALTNDASWHDFVAGRVAVLLGGAGSARIPDPEASTR